jgi:hypothetical protein
MTENEIIKALECCNYNDDCPTDCPLYKNEDCLIALIKPTLDLINCQKAEINVKNKLLDIAENRFKLMHASAVRDFAKWLIDKANTINTADLPDLVYKYNNCERSAEND